MPRLLIEPRPYSLIRVKNSRTPFSSPWCISPLSLSLQLAAPATHHHHAKLCNHAVLPLRCSGHRLRKPSSVALADREACKVVTVVTSSSSSPSFSRSSSSSPRSSSSLDRSTATTASSSTPSHRTRRGRCFLLRTASTPTRSSAYRSSCTSARRRRSRSAASASGAFVDGAKLKVLP